MRVDIINCSVGATPL